MMEITPDWVIPELVEETIANRVGEIEAAVSEAFKSERNSAYIRLIRSLEREATDLNPDIKPPVWFFSTGRCGTFALHSLFRKDKGVVSFHRRNRPLVNRNEVFFGFGLGLGLKNIEWVEEACFDYLTDQVIGEYLSALSLKKQFVSVDNHQVAWLPVIAKVFPRSRLVHLIRHPLDEISSWLSKELFSTLQLHPAYIRNSTFDGYRLFVERDCEWPILKQLAWHWKSINLYIDVLLNCSKTNHPICIHSEDLFSAKMDTYRSISQSCGLTNTLSYQNFKDHFKIKYNELDKKGNYEAFTRESFESGWVQKQGAGFFDLAKKFGYY